MGNPYRDAIEALSGTNTYPNANAAIRYVEGLPDLVAAVAARLQRDGTTFSEDFPAAAAASEIAISLSSIMRKTMTDPTENMRRIFRQVHEFELHRIEQPRHQEAKWDVSLNAD